MVRDFGIMIFQDFLLLAGVYLFLMPLHVMEKKKLNNGLILCGAWGVMILARLLIPAAGEHLIAEFFMRFAVTMIAVGWISRKISWEMIYCTIWPMIIYHCTNIIWNSLHRFSDIGQQPEVLQYLFSLLFFAAVYLLLSITLFRWLPRNGFIRQDQEGHSRQQPYSSCHCTLTTIFTRTVENPILRFWFSYIA